MNPNEIKKCLECCIKDDCDNCLNTFGNCEHNLMSNALAYINQIEAEVDKLQVDLAEEIRRHLNAVDAYLTAKTEAIKEFDEILKEDCLSCPLEAGNVTMLVDVDSYNNLVKEMVGEQKV